MIGVRLNTSDLIKTLKNTVEYSTAFVQEIKRQEPKLAQKVGDLSVEVFYEYLDGLARSHPGMLHHVYEWGQIGNPFGRLYELGMAVGKRGVTITAEFLQSDVPSPTSNEPFYDKAQIMEDGIPVVVTEKDAEVLFFEIDGEEFFRHGPIYIANPGGSATRGAFVKAFNDFYTNYFSQVYLTSIKFYNHFEDPKEFTRNFARAVKTRGGADRAGRSAALSWVAKAPGGNL